MNICPCWAWRAMHVQNKRDFDGLSAMSTRCMRNKSVLSRHLVYTMHMKGAAAQGWSAEGLTVTQWIISHNSSGSEAGAWFSLTLSPPLSLASLDGPSCNSIPAAAVTRWRRLSSSLPGFGVRDVLLLCMFSRPRVLLYERGARRKHVQFVRLMLLRMPKSAYIQI